MPSKLGLIEYKICRAVYTATETPWSGRIFMMLDSYLDLELYLDLYSFFCTVVYTACFFTLYLFIILIHNVWCYLMYESLSFKRGIFVILLITVCFYPALWYSSFIMLVSVTFSAVYIYIFFNEIDFSLERKGYRKDPPAMKWVGLYLTWCNFYCTLWSALCSQSWYTQERCLYDYARLKGLLTLPICRRPT